MRAKSDLRIPCAALSIAILGVAGCAAAPESTDAARISRPNEYAGWSDRIYDGYERTSFYVPVRDGTRLAIDLYRPTKAGMVASEELPVIWMHTPYNRRTYRGGEAAESYPGFALRLAPYSYNIAVVDFRGVTM